MQPDRTKLLKQRFAIEQLIYKLKKSSLDESKQSSASTMMLKLESELAKVNQLLSEAGGHIDPSTYTQEPDHEVQMARNDLYRTAKRAIMLHEILQRLDEKQGLEGWVQAKITKAADYIETVWEYLSYEMRFPYDEQGYKHNESVSEVTYGPGEEAPQAPGAPATTTQAKPGQTSPTPQAGGATPGGGTPGMVKMAKLGPDKKPTGTPIMVRSADIANKQKVGYAVIGENASAGATSAGGIAGSPTGFASGGIGMQKRKKKVKEDDVEEGIVKNIKRGMKGWPSPGLDGKDAGKPKDVVARVRSSDDEFLKKVSKQDAAPHSPAGLQKAAATQELKRREKKTEGTMSDAEKESTGPKFTGYYKGKDKGRPGKKMVGGE